MCFIQVDYLKNAPTYPEKIIAASFSKSSQRITEESDPITEVYVGHEDDRIHILVFFNEKSEFDPYVLTETTMQDNKIVVVINLLHPHIQEMKSSDSLLNFFRHCVYDGVAEWKAIKIRGSIQPYTVKLFKDGLLRIPFEIKSNKAV
ncbi:MAG: hypothetical protein JWO03_1701 [Bacteroidetes bacterium]|nr:hypothetical protein [Bacteroidota bacterium]